MDTPTPRQFVWSCTAQNARAFGLLTVLVDPEVYEDHLPELKDVEVEVIPAAFTIKLHGHPDAVAKAATAIGVYLRAVAPVVYVGAPKAGADIEDEPVADEDEN